MGALRHVDGLHGAGVQTGVVHAGGQGAGGGVEVLDLLRLPPGPVQPLGQGDGVVQGAAGMGGHEIGDQELVLPVLLVQTFVFLLELFISTDVGLAHGIQHMAHAVLGGHLQLSADVMLHQIGEELSAFVLQQIVEADARPDEDLFHAGDLPEFPEQAQVVAVVGIQIGTGPGGQTVPVPAQAVLQLILAGRAPEIGGGPAYVVDVALEAGVSGQSRDFTDDALMAPGGDHPPLVEGQGAEFTGAETPAVVDDGEADLFNGRNTSQRVVGRVRLPLVGQFRHVVQLRRGQRGHRGIDDEIPLPMGLDHRPAPDRVVFVVLRQIGGGVGPFVSGNCFKGSYLHRRERAGVGASGGKAGAFYSGDPGRRRALHQESGDLQSGLLAHAVHQQIRLRVEQEGPAHLVVPVVIMGEPPERGLQTSHDDGDVAEDLPDLVAVDDGCPVGTQTGPVSRGIGVIMPPLFRCGVVGYHGVDIPAVDEDAVPRPAQGSEGFGVCPVGLGQDGDTVARVLQQPADDRRAEGGVVHIGVPGDQEEVAVVPVPAQHLLPGYG